MTRPLAARLDDDEIVRDVTLRPWRADEPLDPEAMGDGDSVMPMRILLAGPECVQVASWPDGSCGQVVLLDDRATALRDTYARARARLEVAALTGPDPEHSATH